MRCNQECIFVFMYSDRYIEFSRKIFETNSSIKFLENPSRKRRNVTADGRTDRETYEQTYMKIIAPLRHLWTRLETDSLLRIC
jgi:hypothetical protein